MKSLLNILKTESFLIKMKELLDSKKPNNIKQAILGLTMNEVDYELAETVCVKYSKHEVCY